MHAAEHSLQVPPAWPPLLPALPPAWEAQQRRCVPGQSLPAGAKAGSKRKAPAGKQAKGASGSRAKQKKVDKGPEAEAAAITQEECLPYT